MNKTARARGTYAPEPRDYWVQFMDMEEASWYRADRGEVQHGTVLMLEGAAQPSGERLFIPISNIRAWWSEPAADDENAPPPL